MGEFRSEEIVTPVLPPRVVEAMRVGLATVAERTIAAVVREVPSYSEPFKGRMGRNIESAVVITLGGFLDLLAGADPEATGSRIKSVFDAAYALGRGEARSGRSMDALASAYRVGARTAWRDMSAIAVTNDLPAPEVARFAESVFEYIDRISAVSVAGHADEIATTGRVRERHLERLAEGILEAADDDALTTYAERAEWPPPTTLTAVVVPASAASSVRTRLASGTLATTTELPSIEEEVAVLLVPDVPRRGRAVLLQAVGEAGGVVGPARPWTLAHQSFQRAARLRTLRPDDTGALDSEEHLATLVLQADPASLADLRRRVLAPMADLRTSTAEKLRDTLRSWLLHQGRREDVANELFVHPQTVRYRMGQLRDLYGERLTDPDFVRDATIALAGL